MHLARRSMMPSMDAHMYDVADKCHECGHGDMELIGVEDFGCTVQALFFVTSRSGVVRTMPSPSSPP